MDQKDSSNQPLTRTRQNTLRIIGISLGILSIGFAIAIIGYLYTTKNNERNSRPSPSVITPSPIQSTGS